MKAIGERRPLRGDGIRSVTRVEYRGIDLPYGLLRLEESIGRQFAVLLLKLGQDLLLVNLLKVEVEVGEVAHGWLLEEGVVHPMRLALVVIGHLASSYYLLELF